MDDSKTGLSLHEVAQVLETTPLNVLMHIKRGLLEGTEEVTGWRVSAASLERFIGCRGGRKAQLIRGRGCGGSGGCGSNCS